MSSHTPSFCLRKSLNCSKSPSEGGSTGDRNCLSVLYDCSLSSKSIIKSMRSRDLRSFMMSNSVRTGSFCTVNICFHRQSIDPTHHPPHHPPRGVVESNQLLPKLDTPMLNQR